MFNPLQNVRPGQRIQRSHSAQTENMVRDAARAHFMSKLKWGVRGPKAGRRNDLRWVVCVTDGGDPGSAETLTRTSYTYTLYEEDETTVIAENVPLEGIGNRVVYAEMFSATRGIARRNQDGEWKLVWCDEAFSQYNCEITSSGSGS